MSAPVDVEQIAGLEKEIAQLNNLIKSKKRAVQLLRGDTKEKLTNAEIGRYSRQVILKEIRPAGQLQLKKARVLIVGAGGLGEIFTKKKLNDNAFDNKNVNFLSPFIRMSSGIIPMRCWCGSHWYL